jgi:hypothetical protein
MIKLIERRWRAGLISVVDCFTTVSNSILTGAHRGEHPAYTRRTIIVNLSVNPVKAKYRKAQRPVRQQTAQD